MTYKIQKSLTRNEEEVVNSHVSNIFGIITNPKVDFHFLLLENDELLGYCALVQRIIRMDEEITQLFLLGLVSVQEDYRKKRLGSHLLQMVQEKVKSQSGIILNCGKDLEPFYRKNNFIHIADSAMYERENALVEDSDPVLYWGKALEKDKYQRIILGEDF